MKAEGALSSSLRVVGALVLGALVSCGVSCSVSSPRQAEPMAPLPRANGGATWSYDVAPSDDGAVLAVSARMLGPASEFAFVRGAEAFAKEVRIARAGESAGEPSGAPLTPNPGGVYFTADGCHAGCTLRYTFALAAAARSLHEDDMARVVAPNVYEAPLPTFVIHPLEAPKGGRFVLRVHEAASFRYATGGLRGDEAGDAKSSRFVQSSGDADALPYAPYGLFGDVERIPVDVGKQHVLLAVPRAAKFGVPREALRAWVARSGDAVSALYGRFPIDDAMVGLVPRGRGSVGFGRTMAGAGTGAILVDVGGAAGESDLKADWVLAHEMIHLAFPSLPYEQRWLEEGLATYLEPVARVRAGLLDEDAAWWSVYWGVPNGLPAPGDLGLDHTFTWGRVYWGGALFCLIADMELRKASGGAKGLPEAMRAILEAGGDDRARWDAPKTLAIGDKALGVNVLVPLYHAWGGKPVAVDLNALFESLGVVKKEGEFGVVLKDGAKLSAMRRAIMRGGS